MDTIANLIQIYGSDLRGFLIALVAAAAFSLAKEAVPHETLQQHQAWLIPAWWWFRALSLGAALVILVGLWWRGDNLVLNGSFSDAKQHWGTGYYEDLLRNGNWDTPETNTNYRKAMFNFPYVLHMPRPARSAETDPVPISTGRPDYVPNRFLGGRHAFRIDFDSDAGPNRFGTLSQRICNLKPHHNYKARFQVRAEKYTPGALFLTTELNWRECISVRISKLSEWEKQECRFQTGDTDQVDFRLVVQGPARLWITALDVRRE